jgi:predicted nuclease with TOPRIM domain
MTFEELQAEFLKIQEENKTLKTTKETLEAESKTKDTRITELQEHNQKLFLKLTAPEPTKPTEPQVQSLEEFAKTLKL